MAAKTDFGDIDDSEFEEEANDEEKLEEEEREIVESRKPIKKIRPQEELSKPIPRPVGRPALAAQQNTDTEIQNRYNIYNVPERVGIIDNETKQPIAETADMQTLILLAVTDILNRVDRIEKSL